MQVLFASPFAPFRGGIAKHSDMVARALVEANIDLQLIGFRRLYPKWLYPGASDIDNFASPHRDIAIACTLDTVDPRSWLTTGRMIGASAGMLVAPAWTFFTSPCLGTVARQARGAGAEIVMLVHNASDHEASKWKNHLTNWQLAAADRFVTHTHELAEQLKSAGHKQPVTVVAHPPYTDFPEPETQLPQERALELLCFGLVRPYKGVDIALRALALSGLDNVRLTIAGEIWEGGEELRRLAADPRLAGKVELRDGYQSDEQAAQLFTRCDAVILPYRSITGSGVLAMAQRYRKPVVASDLPSLKKLVTEGQLGWTFQAQNEQALASLLRNEVTRQEAAAIGSAMPTSEDYNGWSDLAAAILGR